MSESQPKIGILTVSDRASRGAYEDKSGPAIEEVLREYIATPCAMKFASFPTKSPSLLRLSKVSLPPVAPWSVRREAPDQRPAT